MSRGKQPPAGVNMPRFTDGRRFGAAVFALVVAAVPAGCAGARHAPVVTPVQDLPDSQVVVEAAEPSDFGGAGSSLLPLSPTRIRRLAEDLLLRRHDGFWSVEVMDVFEAGPAPETVDIGLPDFEAASGDGSARPTLLDVEITVDGVEIAPRFEPPPGEEDLGTPGGIKRFYSWRIEFQSEERKIVRLRYRLANSRAQQGDELLFYYLNTGTPWAGSSGRVNVRIELGDASPSDLVTAWLRPRNYRVGEDYVVWRLDADEPEEDLVIGLRPFRDPLDGYADRSGGLLSLPESEWRIRLANETPRGWRFWRAFLRARSGVAPADSTFREILEGETWYHPVAESSAPRDFTSEENKLFQQIGADLRDWESSALPSPEELRGDFR